MEAIRRFDLAESYRDKLIYVDPCLKKGHTPILNPLECHETDERLIELQAQHVTQVFEAMISESTLSLNMRALLQPCLFVLLLMSHTSFSDLQQFINGRDLQFLERGRTCGIPSYERFFKEEYQHPHYNRTKSSLSTKLQSLLNAQVFYAMTH